MKKILSLLLVLIFTFAMLTSCGDDETPDVPAPDAKTNIKLSVLNGTTGFGMAHLMEQNANGNAQNNYQFTVETAADNVEKALIAGSIDMAALPTNSAAKVYNKTNGNVQIVAINTLGVLYLVDKTGEITDIKQLENKTIYVPAQNPTFITKHILETNGVKNVTVDSTKYANPQALQAAVKAGQVDYAVLPQPVVTAAVAAAKQAGFNYNIALDLTKEWNAVNSEKLVQGCIVVRKDFAKENKAAVEKFLNEYEASIKFLNENNKDAAALIAKHQIFANATIAEKAIPKCNIVFMVGSEMKSAMSAFVNAMYNIDKGSVGEKIPLDDFYYISE